MNDFVSNEAGFSLLEVIIAIAIAGLITSAGTDLLYSTAQVNHRMAGERKAFSSYAGLRAELRNLAAGAAHVLRPIGDNHLSIEIRTLTKTGIIDAVPYSDLIAADEPARHLALDPGDAPRLMVLQLQAEDAGRVEKMLPDLSIRIPDRIHGPGR